MAGSDWRATLPTLTSRSVSLREPIAQDVGALVDLLSITDASRFGLDYPVTELAVHELIERARRERHSRMSCSSIPDARSRARCRCGSSIPFLRPASGKRRSRHRLEARG